MRAIGRGAGLVLLLAALAWAGTMVARNLQTVDIAPDRAVEGGDPEAGRRAIVAYGCGGCHAIPGIRTARGVVGPPLRAMGARAYVAGNLPNTPDNLVAWIMDPQDIEPGTAMLDLSVTEEDARAIAAYLYTLR